MSAKFRYELKFVLDEVRAVEASHWLHFHTAARNTYPDRRVNSLYFDDVDFSSVRDNLAGVSDRKKIRLRWYQNIKGDGTGFPVFEIKVREGRLGKKFSFQLPDFQGDLMELKLSEIMLQVNQELVAQGILFHDYMAPTLYVSYVRSYYEDFDGLRITMDKDIKFHGVSPHQNLGKSLVTRYPLKIMEMKFPPSMKNKVSKLIRPLHIIPKRHSKYLVGLAVMRQVVYI